MRMRGVVFRPGANSVAKACTGCVERNVHFAERMVEILFAVLLHLADLLQKTAGDNAGGHSDDRHAEERGGHGDDFS